MLKQGRPPQFKARVTVLPAGIGDVEKNEMERGICSCCAGICGEMIAGERADAGIGSELVKTLNPFEAAAVKFAPTVRLLTTIDILDAAAMPPDTICRKKFAPGNAAGKLMLTAGSAATIAFA